MSLVTSLPVAGTYHSQSTMATRLAGPAASPWDHSEVVQIYRVRVRNKNKELKLQHGQILPLSISKDPS